MTYFRISAPVHRAAAAKDSRFSLASIGAFFPRKGEDGVLAATDGKMLAAVPATVVDRGTLAPTALLPLPAVKAARFTTKNPMPAIAVDGNMARADKSDAAYPLPEGTFPPVVEVLPTDARIESGRAFAFNAFMLAKLAEAIGSDDGVVTVIFDADGNRPMTVTCKETDAVGVLMPCAVPASAQTTAITRLSAIRTVIRAAEADAKA
jgi:hypothetical protein